MRPPLTSIIALAPVSVTKGDTQTAIIDCRGFEYLIVTVCATEADAKTPSSSKKMCTATLSESDTKTAADFSEIPGMIADGLGKRHANRGNPDGANCADLGVDLRVSKRYVMLTVDAHGPRKIWATALLFGPNVLHLSDEDIYFLNQW